MRVGVTLTAIGIAIMAAEIWITATGWPILGGACLVLTAITTAIIVGELRAERRP